MTLFATSPEPVGFMVTSRVATAASCQSTLPSALASATIFTRTYGVSGSGPMPSLTVAPPGSWHTALLPSESVGQGVADPLPRWTQVAGSMAPTLVPPTWEMEWTKRATVAAEPTRPSWVALSSNPAASVESFAMATQEVSCETSAVARGWKRSPVLLRSTTMFALLSWAFGSVEVTEARVRPGTDTVLTRWSGVSTMCGIDHVMTPSETLMSAVSSTPGRSRKVSFQDAEEPVVVGADTVATWSAPLILTFVNGEPIRPAMCAWPTV